MTGLCGDHALAPAVGELRHPSLYAEGKGRDGGRGGGLPVTTGEKLGRPFKE